MACSRKEGSERFIQSDKEVGDQARFSRTALFHIMQLTQIVTPVLCRCQSGSDFFDALSDFDISKQAPQAARQGVSKPSMAGLAAHEAFSGVSGSISLAAWIFVLVDILFLKLVQG